MDTGCATGATVVDLCARSVGVDPATLQLFSSRRCRGSIIAVVGAANDDGGKRYVVKTPATASRAAKWNPEREFAALQQLSEVAPQSREFGIVEGIGVGSSPPHLVTRFVDGVTLTSLMLKSSSDQDFILNAARSSGRWAAAMQESHAAEGEGVTPDAFVSSCRECVDQILQSGRLDLDGARIIETVAKAVSRADEPALARIGSAFPSHGDYVPDNILVDRTGCIYPFDPEGFGYAPLDRDLMRFKFWMQRLIGRRHRRRASLQSYWHAVCAGYVAGGGNEYAASLSYLHYVLHRLAWRSERRSRLPRSPRALLSWWDDRVWLQTWIQYVTALGEGRSDIHTLWQEVIHG